MDEQTPTQVTAAQRQAASGVLPGIAMLAIILSGIGVFAYSTWRESHPIPRAPADVEPQLKQPGVVPQPARGD
jgi:hypothetical protein